MKRTHRIVHFDDYHEIPEAVRDGNHRIELGCFPTKGFSYYRYYGLFYSGRRPSLDAILIAVLPMIRWPKDCTFTANNLESEIKQNLKP